MLSYRNILIKSLLFFLALNLLFGLVDPLPVLGRISAYNRLFPGRQRLPYGDQPERSYSLSLFNLDAMFASHEIAAGPKPDGEYRVLVVGDSSVWGYLLSPGDTLSAQINAAGLRLQDGRQVRAFNLGYPVMSVTKDLLILSRAMRYEPDLIVWPLTLESLPAGKQLFPPLLQNNSQEVKGLVDRLDLDPGRIHLDTLRQEEPGFWQRSIIGQRRSLADLLRLQLYGVLWATTGIDQEIPEEYTQRMEDLPDDDSFHDLQPPALRAEDLAFEVLAAGVQMAGTTPLLFVNEPVFISQGENSDIRYNYYYPRWAYDSYRDLMLAQAEIQGWRYLDLWNAVDPAEFTNTAVHLSPEGQRQMAGRVSTAILEIGNSAKP